MNVATPYQPPSAEVISEPVGELILREHPHACTPGQSWDWVKDGFDLFKSNAGNWIGMIIIYMVVMIALSVIPILGSLATMILGPVFSGGFMIACRNMEQGNANFSDMFAGFQEKFASLVVLGLMYFGLLLVPLLLLFAVGLGGLFMGSDPATLESASGLGTTAIVSMLVYMALMIPIVMGVWFAPALIVFHDFTPWSAYKASFSGCLRNIIPFLIYGVILLVLMILAVIPLGLGLLVLTPTVIASIYKSYKTIFLR